MEGKPIGWPPEQLLPHLPALLLGGVSVFSIITAIILLVKTTQTSEPIEFSTADIQEKPTAIMVDVQGAVVRPGVYQMDEGSRVVDVITRAGGFIERADTQWVAKSLNQAGFLTDGGKLYIPFISSSGVTGNSSVSQGISINSASETLLDGLPGVGAVTVQKIISNRPYQRIEELVERNILSKSVFEKIKPSITL